MGPTEKEEDGQPQHGDWCHSGCFQGCYCILKTTMETGGILLKNQGAFRNIRTRPWTSPDRLCKVGSCWGSPGTWLSVAWESVWGHSNTTAASHQSNKLGSWMAAVAASLGWCPQPTFSTGTKCIGLDRARLSWGCSAPLGAGDPLPCLLDHC